MVTDTKTARRGRGRPRKIPLSDDQDLRPAPARKKQKKVRKVNARSHSPNLPPSATRALLYDISDLYDDTVEDLDIGLFVSTVEKILADDRRSLVTNERTQTDPADATLKEEAKCQRMVANVKREVNDTTKIIIDLTDEKKDQTSFRMDADAEDGCIPTKLENDAQEIQQADQEARQGDIACEASGENVLGGDDDEEMESLGLLEDNALGS